jgi:ferredoxin
VSKGNQEEQPMRVIVDESLCEANGFCESLAPDVFEIGKADVVHVADGEVPEHLQIDVHAAIDQCPKAALRLAD